jgi:hypothetical protein
VRTTRSRSLGAGMHSPLLSTTSTAVPPLSIGLAVNPNLAWAWQNSAWVKAFLGEPEEPIRRLTHTLRLRWSLRRGVVVGGNGIAATVEFSRRSTRIGSALVGVTGVGGGSLMTPIVIVLFGVSPATAVGTDLLFAAATKTVGSLVHGFCDGLPLAAYQ